MQTAPDDFLPAGGGADPGAAPGGPPQGADPTVSGEAQAAADPGGDFMAGGGADPTASPGTEYSDEEVAAADHSGAVTAGPSGQHQTSGVMESADETEVSQQEQHAYDDFVTRALLFINDPRKPAGKDGKPNEDGKAPRDVIIDHLNVTGMKADQAVGRTTAQVAWLLFTNAKHQGVDYPPDVLYHGADEIMSHVYEIGVRSGAIKNPPPADSPQEQKLLGMAKLYACQYFGNNVIDSGLNNQDEARQFYMQQLQREADSGALEHWNPSDQISPNQLSDFLSRAAQGKAALASGRYKPPSSISDFQSRGHPRLVPQGGAPGGAPQQQAPPPDQGGDPNADPNAPPPDDGSGGDPNAAPPGGM
jgi:hypothetical protein